MHIVAIIDKSGSMYGFEEGVIEGYNAFLKTLDETDKVTTVLFDTTVKSINKKTLKNGTPQLSRFNYTAGGGTRLYDAIGSTLQNLKKNKNTIVLIFTDGHENSSKEWDKNRVKALIEERPKWKFQYFGSEGLDSFDDAANIGIANVTSFRMSKSGVYNSYTLAATESVRDYKASVDSSYKQKTEAS